MMLFAAAMILPAAAQYPTVPDSVKQRAAQQSAVWDMLADAAWEKALPIIEQEEKEFGRVYRPWASKPQDQPQMDLLCHCPSCHLDWHGHINKFGTLHTLERHFWG